MRAVDRSVGGLAELAAVPGIEAAVGIIWHRPTRNLKHRRHRSTPSRILSHQLDGLIRNARAAIAARLR